MSTHATSLVLLKKFIFTCGHKYTFLFLYLPLYTTQPWKRWQPKRHWCSFLSSTVAPAWWGFTTSADRQRIDAVLRRAVRSDLWTSAGTSDAQTFEDLCNSIDDVLFTKVRTFSNHILHTLLPPPSTASQNYSLRHRSHSFQLPVRSTHLSDCHFITRMLYKNCY